VVPPQPRPFDAIILAGGRGTRMGGADKPGLVVGGQTLLGSVLSAVAAAGVGRVVVVGPPRPGPPEPEQPGRPANGQRGPLVSYVREQPAGAGPGAALRRGVEQVAAPAAALLAADLPFLRAGHLAWLLAALDGQPERAGVVLADDSGQPQWLASCWRTATLRAAARGYPGRSLHGLLGPLRPVLLRYHRAGAEPPPWLDCDTPEDLSRARAWSEQEASQ
jgi:molybdenum cofactor guanylyltransferase